MNTSIYTIPQKKLFWSSLSFGEECRSVTFVPNHIFTMFLVPICQKPNSKISHHSCTVARHLSTRHRWNFTKLDASYKFESCLSFYEECMSENLHKFSWQNNMQKTPLKVPHHCLTILKCLSKSHIGKIMILTKSTLIMTISWNWTFSRFSLGICWISWNWNNKLLVVLFAFNRPIVICNKRVAI